MYRSFKDNRLLPCPFCGEDAEVGWYTEEGKKDKYYVGCCSSGCCELNDVFYDLNRLIDAWNNRRLVKEDGQWIVK